MIKFMPPIHPGVRFPVIESLSSFMMIQKACVTCCLFVCLFVLCFPNHLLRVPQRETFLCLPQEAEFIFLESITVIHVGLSMWDVYDGHESDWSAGDHY